MTTNDTTDIYNSGIELAKEIATTCLHVSVCESHSSLDKVMAGAAATLHAENLVTMIKELGPDLDTDQIRKAMDHYTALNVASVGLGA